MNSKECSGCGYKKLDNSIEVKCKHCGSKLETIAEEEMNCANGEIKSKRVIIG